jgi:hypothetical protein
MKIEDFAGSGVGQLAVTGSALADMRSGDPVPRWPAEKEEGWILPLDHFSASSLQMFEICPRQWQQRYILGKIEPPAQAKLLGQVTHGGIEFGLDTKLTTQDEPELDLIITYYHDAVWPSAIEMAGGYNEIVWDPGTKPDDVRDKGAQMITTYHPTIARLEPEAVEHFFQIDTGAQVPVTGWIDLVQKDGRPSVDFKTSNRKLTEVKPGWRVQGRVYQLAIPRPVDFHVITKAKWPQVFTGLDSEGLVEDYSELKTQDMKRRIRQALDDANRYYATYGPDEDWPARGIVHDWRCAWCGYQAGCPAWP